MLKLEYLTLTKSRRKVNNLNKDFTQPTMSKTARKHLKFKIWSMCYRTNVCRTLWDQWVTQGQATNLKFKMNNSEITRINLMKTALLN